MQQKDGTQRKDGRQQVMRLLGAIVCNAAKRWHATSNALIGSNRM